MNNPSFNSSTVKSLWILDQCETNCDQKGVYTPFVLYFCLVSSSSTPEE